MIYIFLGTNISHLEENKILVIDSTVPEEVARKVTGTMVQDGVIFFACDSVAEITKTFLVVQL